jgi:hypothetical protein
MSDYLKTRKLVDLAFIMSIFSFVLAVAALTVAILKHLHKL